MCYTLSVLHNPLTNDNVHDLESGGRYRKVKGDKKNLAARLRFLHEGDKLVESNFSVSCIHTCVRCVIHEVSVVHECVIHVSSTMFVSTVWTVDVPYHLPQLFVADFDSHCFQHASKFSCDTEQSSLVKTWYESRCSPAKAKSYPH